MRACEGVRHDFLGEPPEIQVDAVAYFCFAIGGVNDDRLDLADHLFIAFDTQAVDNVKRRARINEI